MISFGPWTPDATNFNTANVDDISGCLPIPNGWAPFPSHETISDALPSRCLGAVTVRVSDSNYATFAGTRTHIYKYNSSTLGWDDVSGAAYNVPDGDLWEFQLFGTTLFATNFTDGLISLNLSSGTAFAPATVAGGSTAIPKARYIGAMGDYMVLGCLVGAESSVQWCALNDPTNWTPGVDGADIQQFPDGGAVRGMALGEIGLIFQEDTIRKATLVGGTFTFQFQAYMRNKRLMAPHSVVAVGGRVFALMENGFHMYGDQGEVPIGKNAVDNFFQSNCSAKSLRSVIGCYDPVKTRVYWGYRTSSNTADTLNRVIFFDWVLGRWGKIDLDCEIIFPATTAGYTLDGLDMFGSIDELPYSLDSNLWGGGNPGLAAFSTAHRFGFIAGGNLSASVTSSEMALNGGRLAMVTGITPITDADGVSITVGGRDRRGGTDRVVWGSPSSMEVDGTTHHHANARYVTVKAEIPAGATWTHLIGGQEIMTDGGAR